VSLNLFIFILFGNANAADLEGSFNLDLYADVYWVLFYLLCAGVEQVA